MIAQKYKTMSKVLVSKVQARKHGHAHARRAKIRLGLVLPRMLKLSLVVFTVTFWHQKVSGYSSGYCERELSFGRNELLVPN